VEEAGTWLRKLLRDGRKPSTEVMAAARTGEIPAKVLYAARKRARVRIVRDGKERRWYWQLRPLEGTVDDLLW
jgi:hypothetical protein